MLTKTKFCANCQTNSNHSLVVDQYNEIIATCDVCGQFRKYSADLSPDQIKELMSKEEDTHKGQVKAADVEAKHVARQQMLTLISDN